MAASLAIGYIFQKSIAKRTMLFVSSIIIAVIMNTARLVATALFAHMMKATVVPQTIHDRAGIVATIVGYGILFFINDLLAKNKYNHILRMGYRRVSGCICAFSAECHTYAAKKSFLYFPFEIDGWKDKEKANSDYLISALGADDILVREYENKDEEKLELYFSYFIFTKKGKTPHAPQLCWVGSGWAFKDLIWVRK
jgi:exosortase/archaeosortase family protein